VREAINTQLRNQSFLIWLDRYYREVLPLEIKKEMLPSFRSFADLIYKEAAREINAAADPQKLDKFLGEYIDGFVNRYINSSKGQIVSIVNSPNADPDDIEERLNDWEDRRAEKVASNETTRLAGAISKLAYASAGVAYIRWINTSGNPCPYCEEMDNRVVGIDQVFQAAGTDYEPVGAAPLRITGNVGHPPLHQGCQCQIVAD
jgi:hypothetical protein